MFGDYPLGSWSSPSSWSRDSTGGGWLHDAVTGVPGLAAAILANGLGSHPYGALGENSKDSYGINAVAGQETNAKTVLGATPTVYITEFGYDLGRCGEIDGACSQEEQATKMRAAYKVFLADPHVAGICGLPVTRRRHRTMGLHEQRQHHPPHIQSPLRNRHRTRTVNTATTDALNQTKSKSTCGASVQAPHACPGSAQLTRTPPTQHKSRERCRSSTSHASATESQPLRQPTEHGSCPIPSGV